MRVQTFMGKVSIEGLHQMNNHINEWIKRNQIEPLHIQQSFGSDIHHDGRNSEPIVIISIWYKESSAL